MTQAKRMTVLAAAAVATVLAPRIADAATFEVVSPPAFTQSASVQTGTFDIIVTGGVADISLYQASVQLPNASAVTFTTKANTSVDRLFATPSLFDVTSPPNSTTWTVAVASNNAIGVSDLDPRVLITIGFSIPANVTGTFPLTLIDSATDSNAYNALFDTGDNEEEPTLLSGQIVINPTGGVPEPASAALLAVGVAALSRRRRVQG